jgi:predicted house-cleaning noncanonical NTP pyrophosphatase (MazG superfamily)
MPIYNKLVRDKIPEIIKQNGEEPITHIAEEKEYEKALINKLHEEIAEFLENPSVEEMADVVEVMRAICSLKGINVDNLEKVRREKENKRGGFEKRIILDRV